MRFDEAVHGKGYIHKGFATVDNRNECDFLLAGLTEESRQIIVMRYGHGLTVRDIAKRIGCSFARISLRHKAILEHLREKAR